MGFRLNFTACKYRELKKQPIVIINKMFNGFIKLNSLYYGRLFKWDY